MDDERLIQLLIKERKRQATATFWLTLGSAFLILGILTMELLSRTPV